ncbi:MAG: lipoprotein [Halofilum sp. (in: g-proteobacteria)]|nr:lipoprotein [Halofilum sp. (in: g-proteobacteria)]
MSARVLLLAIVLLSAAGCGQKGPLYLPDEGDAQSESE